MRTLTHKQTRSNKQKLKSELKTATAILIFCWLINTAINILFINS